MTGKKRRLKVFLSYDRGSFEKVYALSKRLTEEGADVWVDKDRLDPGQWWENEIRNEICNSDVVVVCLTNRFDQKGFRQKEVRIALEEAGKRPKGQIFIIPTRFENCKTLDDLENLHWVDLFENQPIASEEDGYQSLLRALRRRANEEGATLREKRKRLSKVSLMSLRTERHIPDDLLTHWFIKHGLVNNPFGRTDFFNNPVYPESAVRPDRWEFLLDNVPLFVHCPTKEDAYAIPYLLRREGAPLEYAINDHRVFPVLVWIQQTTSTHPLLALAHSAVRTWLDILPAKPYALLDLQQEEQNALIELLYWSLGSSRVIVNLIKHKIRSENEGISILIKKISDFKSNLISAPQDSDLISWVKIRPVGIKQTCLIFSGDDLFHITSKWQPRQFGTFSSIFEPHGVLTKIFASSFQPTDLSLQEMKLSWSDQWLNLSLDNQFYAAMHTQEQSAGKQIHFHELFGPGITEQETTQKLISASRNSLARMLMLGNRLLQYHCEKRDVAEKYLYPDDLEAILRTV